MSVEGPNNPWFEEWFRCSSELGCVAVPSVQMLKVRNEKDSEIERMMTELGVANQSVVSLLEMREQVQASLAASAFCVGDRAKEVPVPAHHSVQPATVETQSANNAILEANESSSARLHSMSNRVDAVEQRQPMPVHLHGRNGAGVSSLPSSGLPTPTKRFPDEPFGGDPVLMVREKMMMKKKRFRFKMVPQLLKRKLLTPGLYNTQSWTRSQRQLLISGVGRIP